MGQKIGKTLDRRFLENHRFTLVKPMVLRFGDLQKSMFLPLKTRVRNGNGKKWIFNNGKKAIVGNGNNGTAKKDDLTVKQTLNG